MTSKDNRRLIDTIGLLFFTGEYVIVVPVKVKIFQDYVDILVRKMSG